MSHATGSIPTLDEILQQHYSFHVLAEPSGGFTVTYPDLPGCATQVEVLDEVAEAAQEIRDLWLTSMFERGSPIPEPGGAEQMSGKFVVRLPKSLHRRLADRADAEHVSLNQMVVTMLSEEVALSETIGSLRDALSEVVSVIERVAPPLVDASGDTPAAREPVRRTG